MRHNHHGAAFFGQCAHDFEHLANQLGIQRRSRLVKQYDFRLHCQGACNRDALLLSARHGGWVFVLRILQADFGQILARTLGRLGFAHAEYANRSFDQVFQHGHVLPQIKVLKHHGQTAAKMLQLFGIRRHQLSGFTHFEIEHLAIERNRALIRFFQHIDATQKGTFARA